MLKGFRDFILRGNVVDLAVAVIIGAAFAAITNSLVSDIINPLIAAVIGKPDFSAIVWHVHLFHAAQDLAPGAKPDATAGAIQVGKFLNNVISFLLNAAVVYFVIVLPMQKLLSRFKAPEAVTTKACAQCLSDIPLAATRCKFCTQPA
ncbi:large conductance mechanosensitive channel protein MscL [Granulicella sp. WH15]|uniref:large conductance mechanosensitive channel protein MscL n=1 Tax=Granulicella sp. WH15 TaxID=2602070 RepID=UPI001366AAEB|nr:large conductance mechanosensitive channel protein MscL [Granulicella sp. WH15]QHN03834.1 large conductance mechanosensitive channel protein MscL [Granulicella sp. WH15]